MTKTSPIFRNKPEAKVRRERQRNRMKDQRKREADDRIDLGAWIAENRCREGIDPLPAMRSDAFRKLVGQDPVNKTMGRRRIEDRPVAEERRDIYATVQQQYAAAGYIMPSNREFETLSRRVERLERENAGLRRQLQEYGITDLVDDTPGYEAEPDDENSFGDGKLTRGM